MTVFSILMLTDFVADEMRREITEQTEINGTNGKDPDSNCSVCSVYFRLFRNLSSHFISQNFTRGTDENTKYTDSAMGAALHQSGDR
jgi:hypothetical protein